MTRVNGNVTIDRISLRVEGVEPGTARRLAQLVAERLVPALQLSAGEASFERLGIELTAFATEDADAIATRVAGEIAMHLGQRLEAGR